MNREEQQKNLGNQVGTPTKVNVTCAPNKSEIQPISLFGREVTVTYSFGGANPANKDFLQELFLALLAPAYRFPTLRFESSQKTNRRHAKEPDLMINIPARRATLAKYPYRHHTQPFLHPYAAVA